MLNPIYQLDPLSYRFPAVDFALEEPNGLLAVGGDLAPERLISAYRNGIFPWFNIDDPLLWWAPNPRAILLPGELHISSSLKKFLRKTSWTITVNVAFNEVIHLCRRLRTKEGTWITTEMQSAYLQLHQQGMAHSIEVWSNKQIIGGLYGVSVGKSFCGESMFHLQKNASKIAFIALYQWLLIWEGYFIDCQIPTPHLATLGVQARSREYFMKLLTAANQADFPKETWQPQQINI